MFVLLLTLGEKGGDPSVRYREAREAAKIVGAELLDAGSFPDGGLQDNLDTVEFIELNIEKTGAQVIFSPSTKDRHQDHRKAALASISASHHASEVYQYETPNTLQEFSPQVFVDIEPYLAQKKRALDAHQSQSWKSYLATEAVEGLARYRAFQAWGGRRKGAVEAFELIRLVASAETEK